ncbi:MAG: prephenate dehydrogenase/arogenate dehydrogenase family protein, partial [Chloroflexi bacterium]|nr:prephenate dehydrogenase/arogenate dehydrogenase family protein [Chloroflexota bacterium]
MRVAILGTGLIGTSIGLGLRNRVPDVQVVGYDRSRNTSEAAKQRGALDEVALSAKDAVRDARLVILAVPILAIRPLMEEIRDALPESAVVTDTGSSKAEVMRWARELLPGHANFVAGHPMAGKTEFGPAAAEETLFEGARWVVVPSVHAGEDAIRIVTNMAEYLGANTMVMDAEEHDAYVAAISHMPMVAATALFSLGRSSEAWPELSLLAAGGFKDMTRLAATDADMAYDIVVTNRENIAHWIDRYVAALVEFRRRLMDMEGEDDLYRVLAATEIDYKEYRDGKVGRVEKGKPEVEGGS